MAAKRIIPCLDFRQGRGVKGIQFKELGHRYEAEGADELVFLDIAASEEERGTQDAWVREVARGLFIPFTVGGGVASVEDIRRLLQAGADKVAINTAAVRDPDLLTRAASIFGRQCIVAAVDVARDPKLGWRVYIQGGKERTELGAIHWLWELNERGAGEILLHSIDRDGKGEGFDLELLREASALPIPVIASGGASTEAHFLDAFHAGAEAALFHEGTLPIERLKRYLAVHGVIVRM